MGSKPMNVWYLYPTLLCINSRETDKVPTEPGNLCLAYITYLPSGHSQLTSITPTGRTTEGW